MNFALRYDGDWLASSIQVLVDIVDKCDSVVFYEHPATPDKGVHIHGLIYGYTRKEDTLRNVLKRITKGSYELKSKIRRNGPPVNEDFITYMSKGKYDPVFLKGWSKDFVDEKKAKGFDVIDLSGGKIVVKKGIKTDGEASGKRTRKELVDGIVNDLGENIRRYDEREICDVIRKHLVRNNEVIGMWKVIDIYDSVLMYGAGDVWADMVARKIFSRNKV